MTTCEPLPGGGGDGEPLTLFAADSLASPSASPGRASRRRIAGGSGQHSQTSFASYDPATSSWRTSSVFLDGEWETFSESWPRSGMTRNGTAYQRSSSVPPIFASESGLLPTPSAVSYGSNQGGGMGRVGPVRPSLETMARHGLWRTPKAADAAHAGRTTPPKPGQTLSLDMQVNNPGLWPTPTANRWDGLQSHGVNAITGQLNPVWVEWLMGYPPGWTDCEDSETP